MREYLTEIRENWNDPYWRADHPEVMAVVLGVISGTLALLFAWLETKVKR
jgi:hypothetical protein